MWERKGTHQLYRTLNRFLMTLICFHQNIYIGQSTLGIIIKHSSLIILVYDLWNNDTGRFSANPKLLEFEDENENEGLPILRSTGWSLHTFRRRKSPQIHTAQIKSGPYAAPVSVQFQSPTRPGLCNPPCETHLCSPPPCSVWSQQDGMIPHLKLITLIHIDGQICFHQNIYIGQSTLGIIIKHSSLIILVYDLWNNDTGRFSANPKLLEFEDENENEGLPILRSTGWSLHTFRRRKSPQIHTAQIKSGPYAAPVSVQFQSPTRPGLCNPPCETHLCSPPPCSVWSQQDGMIPHLKLITLIHIDGH